MYRGDPLMHIYQSTMILPFDNITLPCYYTIPMQRGPVKAKQ